MKITLSGLMSNGKPASDAQLLQARFVLEDPTVAIIQDGEIIPLRAGSTKLIANVNGIKSSVDLTFDESDL